MREASSYQKEMGIVLDEIRKTARSVVIFGAGRGGWYVLKVLERHGISVAAFADNNPDRLGVFQGIPVYSAGMAAQKFPGALVFLGVFTPRAADALRLQLLELGANDVRHCVDAFLFSYFTEVAGRICDRDALAKSIRILFANYAEGPNHYGRTARNCFVSPYVTGVITQKCSLRCRDCAQFMPYYKNPVDYSVRSVVDDIRSYARAFDVVPEVSLHGGEPFLHPDLVEICREVAAIPNVVFVNLITNGTISLSDEKARGLSACGVDIHQSDYGALSRNQDAVFKTCHDNDIYCDVLYVNSNKLWSRPPPFAKHGRTPAENLEIYKKCVSSKICCQIMDGELHRCSVSMHASHQGVFPRFEDDFVRLRGVSQESLTGKVREYINPRKALLACDYCSPFDGEPVPPAIQLREKITKEVKQGA